MPPGSSKTNPVSHFNSPWYVSSSIFIAFSLLFLYVGTGFPNFQVEFDLNPALSDQIKT